MYKDFTPDGVDQQVQCRISDPKLEQRLQRPSALVYRMSIACATVLILVSLKKIDELPRGFFIFLASTATAMLTNALMLIEYTRISVALARIIQRRDGRE